MVQFDPWTRAIHPGKHGEGDWVGEFQPPVSSLVIRPTIAQLVYITGMVGLGQRKVFGIDQALEYYIGGWVEYVLEAETPREVFLVADRCDVVWERGRERRRRG